MRSATLSSFAAVLGLTAAYAIPDTDGFPEPNEQQLLDIEKQAGGLLPNAPPPPELSDAGITNFQLIAFNENFEVAFFSSLIDNITNHVPGFTNTSSYRNEGEILEILKTVKAQEELHALTAITTLQHFNASLVPEPCTYVFPTTTLADAIDLAASFTDLVLGTLQDASQSFAEHGDAGPVRAVASVIGQEGEQEGFYRYLRGRRPAAKPFATTGLAAYAFSALLQAFVAACPFDVAGLPLPVFPALRVLTAPAAAAAADGNLTFSADLAGTPYAAGESGDLGGWSVTYLVGQQKPVSVPVANPVWDGSVLGFQAAFPFEENVMQGFSIAVLTNASGFQSAADLPAHTVAAPGLIQVHDVLTAAQGEKDS
ncbi:sexual development protein [Xylariomycetidae sp. FL0641]|nr:sexual development protein [Xylariomycetidae sp. FL0641]